MVSRVSDAQRGPYERGIPVAKEDTSKDGSGLAAGILISFVTIGLLYAAYFLLY